MESPNKDTCAFGGAMESLFLTRNICGNCGLIGTPKKRYS